MNKEDKVNKENLPHRILDWEQYFILLSFVTSFRSPDAQTQHGCVITNKENKVLGIGYNGFPKGMPDQSLPNYRPDKYPYIIHAEMNALYNCSLRPNDGIAYVTGESCLECVKGLYQGGITSIIQANTHGTYLANAEDREVIQTILLHSFLRIKKVKPNFALFNEMWEKKLNEH